MKFEDLLNEQFLFEEMSNLREEETGLPMVIWIQPKTNKEQHWARIKVAKKYGNKISQDLFTITISNNPEVIGDTGEISNKDVKLAIEFVKKNKKTLMMLWNDLISPYEAIKRFNKIT